MNNRTTRILEVLEAFGDDVHRDMHRVTNYGGCALYAARVCRLLNSLGIEAHGRVIGGGDDVSELEEQYMHGSHNGLAVDFFHDNGVYFSHVITVFTLEGVEYGHDSENTRTLAGFPYRRELVDGTLSQRMLRKLTLSQHGWNHDCSHKELRRVLARRLPQLRNALTGIVQEAA